MTDYADRNFNIITHFDDYVPPVLERKWANHSWGTRYYVLQKGKYDDRYNPENWTRIYNYPTGNRYDDRSVVLDSSELTHPDTSSKATLWMKTQNEGSLTPPCIVWKNLQIPHTV